MEPIPVGPICFFVVPALTLENTKTVSLVFVYYLTDNRCFVLSFASQTKQLRHGSSRKCLAINGARDKLLMEECDVSLSEQMWQFENFNATLALAGGNGRRKGL